MPDLPSRGAQSGPLPLKDPYFPPSMAANGNPDSTLSSLSPLSRAIPRGRMQIPCKPQVFPEPGVQRVPGPRGGTSLEQVW